MTETQTPQNVFIAFHENEFLAYTLFISAKNKIGHIHSGYISVVKFVKTLQRIQNYGEMRFLQAAWSIDHKRIHKRMKDRKSLS